MIPLRKLSFKKPVHFKAENRQLLTHLTVLLQPIRYCFEQQYQFRWLSFVIIYILIVCRELQTHFLNTRLDLLPMFPCYHCILHLFQGQKNQVHFPLKHHLLLFLHFNYRIIHTRLYHLSIFQLHFYTHLIKHNQQFRNLLRVQDHMLFHTIRGPVSIHQTHHNNLHQFNISFKTNWNLNFIRKSSNQFPIWFQYNIPSLYIYLL